MDPHPPDRPARSASLAELSAATDRLVATVRTLDDASLHAPSTLPGWSRGHVVTHLARNADGLGNLVTWAATGVETPMYASYEARATAIEAAAGRPIAEQLADLVSTAERLAARLGDLPPSADDVELHMVSGAEVAGWELPLLRIRELEIHHVDLAAGYGVEAWSDPFCTRTLGQVAPGFAARGDVPFGRLLALDGRSWTVGAGSATLSGPLQLLLGWLVGRADGTGLVPEGRTDVPPAPPWA